MSAACRKRLLLVSSTACSAPALAACGGESPRDGEPSFPAAIGTSLAAQADRVAISLEAGDADGARSAAVTVDAAVERKFAAGRVPSALRQPLREAVDAVLASLPAPAPTTTADEGPGGADKGNGKSKGKGHDEDQGEEGDGGDE